MWVKSHIVNSHSNNFSQYQLTQGPDEIRRTKHLLYLPYCSPF